MPGAWRGAEGPNTCAGHPPGKPAAKEAEASRICYSHFLFVSFFSCFPDPSSFDLGDLKSRLVEFIRSGREGEVMAEASCCSCSLAASHTAFTAPLPLLPGYRHLSAVCRPHEVWDPSVCQTYFRKPCLVFLCQLCPRLLVLFIVHFHFRGFWKGELYKCL